MIKFHISSVSNGTTKARCFYSRFNMASTGQDCVTIYAKDYGHAISQVFGGDCYENNTDSQMDYFDQGHVRIVEGHPLFQAACKAVEAASDAFDRRQAKAAAKWIARRLQRERKARLALS